MCRIAVRGLAASIRQSAIRLKAIAALRAAAMHSTMPTSSRRRNAAGGSSWLPCDQAITAANSANGSANSVWLKRIISRICRRRASMLFLLTFPNDEPACWRCPIDRRCEPRRSRPGRQFRARRDRTRAWPAGRPRRPPTLCACCPSGSSKAGFLGARRSACGVPSGGRWPRGGSAIRPSRGRSPPACCSEQGQITMPAVGNEPLAIGAIRSW